MLIDVEILPILQKADNGCPKCQYIMADYYQHGIGVPEDREKAKHYYKLLADHDPQSLEFMEEDYNHLLALIGYMHYNDGEYEISQQYLIKAMSYIRKNFPAKDAEERILKGNFHKYLEVIMLSA